METAVAQPGNQPEAISPKQSDNHFAAKKLYHSRELIRMGQQDGERFVGGSKEYCDQSAAADSFVIEQGGGSCRKAALGNTAHNGAQQGAGRASKQLGVGGNVKAVFQQL